MIVLSLAPKLEAYISNEAMARFCTSDYEEPTKDNINNVMMHLTNYSINKSSENFIRKGNLEDQNGASKRTLKSLFELMKQYGIDTDYLFEQIKDTISKFLIGT